MHDLGREALDDRRLPDARLADEDRVVLGPPAEHLHHALDLLDTADDRVELPFPSELRQVAAELIQDERAGRCLLTRAGARLLRATLVALEQRDDLRAHLVQVGAKLHEDLRGDAFSLADETQQDVLGPDVVVTELQRFAQGQLENLLRARRERDVTGRRHLALTDDLLDLLAHRLQHDAERLQRLRRDAFTFVDQSEQDVLGSDVVVVEHPRFFLGEDDDPARAVCESFEHRRAFLYAALPGIISVGV